MSDLLPKQASSTPLQNASVAQIGILVEDLDWALDRYMMLCPRGPWTLWTYDRSFVPEMSYRGAPARFSMRIALSNEDPQIELIQPVEGPSVYEEWIATHGFGLHHVGVRVPHLRTAIAQMAQVGHVPIQAGFGYGLDGDGGFAYFDTVPDLGLVVELIETPERRRAPERIITNLPTSS